MGDSTKNPYDPEEAGAVMQPLADVPGAQDPGTAPDRQALADVTGEEVVDHADTSTPVGGPPTNPPTGQPSGAQMEEARYLTGEAYGSDASNKPAPAELPVHATDQTEEQHDVAVSQAAAASEAEDDGNARVTTGDQIGVTPVEALEPETGHEPAAEATEEAAAASHEAEAAAEKEASE